MTTDIINAASGAGPFGLLLLYMAWREKLQAAERKERIEVDKAMASALSALTVTIQTMFAKNDR